MIKDLFHLTPRAESRIRLIFYRAKLNTGIKQSEVAEKLGVTKEYISMIINCKALNIRRQIQVCEAYGLKWEDVFGPYVDGAEEVIRHIDEFAYAER